MANDVGYYEVGQLENDEDAWVILHLARDPEAIGTSYALEADDAIELGAKLVEYGETVKADGR